VADFDDYQRQLITGYTDASRDYDRLVVGISTAALSLTVVFRPEGASSSWWLLGAWFCLILALLAALASIQTSRMAFQVEFQEYDPGEPLLGGPAGGKWGDWTDRFTAVSGIAVAVGVTLLAVVGATA